MFFQPLHRLLLVCEDAHLVVWLVEFEIEVDCHFTNFGVDEECHHRGVITVVFEEVAGLAGEGDLGAEVIEDDFMLTCANHLFDDAYHALCFVQIDNGAILVGMSHDFIWEEFKCADVGGFDGHNRHVG